MPAQYSPRTDRVVGYLLQKRSLTSGWILRGQHRSRKVLNRMQSLLLLDWHGLILNEVKVVHTHFECIMPSCANLPTGYSSCWVPGHIMSYPFHDFYSHELNKVELLSKILVYIVGHMTKNSGMCVIMISVSQPGSMGSKVQWNTTVRDKSDAYKRPSFLRRSLLPWILPTVLCCIQNCQMNW